LAAVLAYIEAKQMQGKKSVDMMPNNLDGDVTKSYRMNTHLCLNVFCVGWHMAVTYSLIQHIS